jgi:hypothetical protein
MKARTERAELPFCSRCGCRAPRGHADDGCGPYCPGCGCLKTHAAGCALDPYATLDGLVDVALEVRRAH